MVAHIFNPQHDLALSEGSPWYRPPKSALQFAADCALLPVWYADEGDSVISPMPDNEWWHGMCERFPRLKNIDIKQNIANGDILEPWGQDAEVYYRLKTEPQVDITRIKELSDRKMTCRAFEHLRKHGVTGLPATPATLTTIEEIDRFIKNNDRWVLKLPLSGSGIGIIKGCGTIDEGMRNRLKTELKRNGHIMGEPCYDKVLDFAMEFHRAKDGKCFFDGYSLFTTTEKGIYAGNLLASNTVIESRIATYITAEKLHTTQILLSDFFSKEYTGYTGAIGVDMMVYKDGTDYRLNPVVEINVRHTMGMVARHFFDNFLNSESEGWLRILRLNHDAIPAGAIQLCPITTETQVAIVADMMKI